MKEIINTQIKKLYKSKASFCQENNHKYKDFASKLRTVETKVNWLNTFLKPLGLRVVVTRVDGKDKLREILYKHTDKVDNWNDAIFASEFDDLVDELDALFDKLNRS